MMGFREHCTLMDHDTIDVCHMYQVLKHALKTQLAHLGVCEDPTNRPLFIIGSMNNRCTTALPSASVPSSSKPLERHEAVHGRASTRRK